MKVERLKRGDKGATVDGIYVTEGGSIVSGPHDGEGDAWADLKRREDLKKGPKPDPKPDPDSEPEPDGNDGPTGPGM